MTLLYISDLGVAPDSFVRGFGLLLVLLLMCLLAYDGSCRTICMWTVCGTVCALGGGPLHPPIPLLGGPGVKHFFPSFLQGLLALRGTDFLYHT